MLSKGTRVKVASYPDRRLLGKTGVIVVAESKYARVQLDDRKLSFIKPRKNYLKKTLPAHLLFSYDELERVQA